MMKPNTENETLSCVDEARNKSREAGLLTSAVQVNQKFTTFVVGLGIGALVGLLFAPASGKKTRNDITRIVKDGLDSTASTGKRWTRRAQETVDDVKANVASVVEAGQKAYRTTRDT